MRCVAAALACSVGCASATPVVTFAGLPEQQRIEKRDLPDRPDSEKIPPEKDWAIPVYKDECVTEDGIFLSPEKAIRAKQWQEGYKNLRNLYELDRTIWGAHRTVYEERLKKANKHIEELTPSWWDANEGNIAAGAGFVLGVLATVAITYVTK